MAEFDGVRAQLYKDALSDFPNARKGDIELMKQYLKPKTGEVVLEVGAGNGLFSGAIADAVLPKGKLIVSDPSLEQLHGVKELQRSNVEILHVGADELNLPESSTDAVWSFGAVHHIFNKTKSFKNFYKALKSGGRLIIGDVFVGSKLAQHFDDRVAKYCVTGHDVSFLSPEYTESLCQIVGFQKPEFHNFNARWEFDSREDVGAFLYKLHAMTKTTPEECLRGAEDILGIEEKDGKFYLNWPMVMVVIRR